MMMWMWRGGKKLIALEEIGADQFLKQQAWFRNDVWKWRVRKFQLASMGGPHPRVCTGETLRSAPHQH